MIFPHELKREDALDQYGFCICTADSKKVRLHGHDFLEFTYIEKGTIEHSFGDKTETLTAGDYFIVDYGTKHCYHSADGEPISVINLLFYPNFIDRTLGRWDNFEKVVNSYLIHFKYRSLHTSPAGVAFRDQGKTVYGILQSILGEYAQCDAGFLEYIRCLIVQILIITIRKISKHEGETTESGVIKAITDSIKEHYSEHLVLSDYARQYAYSLSHISKKFTEEMGVGFTEYLQRIRIEQSCKLLESGEMTVSEVAARVGYGDTKFWGKIFKKTLGVTPREFKKTSR